jgi:hypothetical protein
MFGQNSVLKTMFGPNSVLKTMFGPNSVLKTMFGPNSVLKTMFGPNSVLKTMFGTKYKLQGVGEHYVIRNFMILRPTSTKYCKGLLLGTLKGMRRKNLETGISLHRGPVGEPGGGLICCEL